MSRNDTGHTESETDRCRVQFRCSCGETTAGEGAYLEGEIDLSTECDSCGRRHVVTITEVRGAVAAAPTLER